MDDGYGQRGITPAMRRIEAQLEQGELVQDTEKFALKSADRFKEKLARMISESLMPIGASLSQGSLTALDILFVSQMKGTPLA